VPEDSDHYYSVLAGISRERPGLIVLVPLNYAIAPRIGFLRRI